jgi:transcription initiation factor TFIIIB Brf1 subunit/transcription initiation factor TFIIB
MKCRFCKSSRLSTDSYGDPICGDCGNAMGSSAGAQTRGPQWDAYSLLLLDRDHWRDRALVAEKLISDRKSK